MGKKRYTTEQIALALRQSEPRTSVTEFARKLGVSKKTSQRDSGGLRDSSHRRDSALRKKAVAITRKPETIFLGPLVDSQSPDDRPDFTSSHLFTG